VLLLFLDKLLLDLEFDFDEVRLAEREDLESDDELHGEDSSLEFLEKLLKSGTSLYHFIFA